MTTPGQRRATPAEHWASVQRRLGTAVTVERCIEVLSGAVTIEHPSDPAFTVLGGGNHLQRILDGVSPDYWIRVWAARGLLYVWDDTATAAVITGLSDDAWRVREMCAKVARLRLLGQAGDDLARLVADDVPRVRSAAVRALADVGEAEHAAALRQALDDQDRSVADAADRARITMAQRLDRDLSGTGDD
ncbi:HEAT repeat domain-containing protein [Microlunatus soli]|uniref:HEAT repeat-containing protein n=1 Tax=Microlunatus soli TaxID=630515 RepID=A0A1H1WDY7_9ACTN|nr:HEAT repeat domain-containing protein [Microlunatus soli]SDS95235.1 hypothetical protein SAMN04489812_3609 [Microlunatus soli]